MHHFEIPFDDPEEVIQERVDDLTERLKGDEPKEEILRRRNILVKWLQDRIGDVKELGQVRVVRKSIRSNPNMHRFMDEI